MLRVAARPAARRTVRGLLATASHSERAQRRDRLGVHRPARWATVRSPVSAWGASPMPS